MTNLKLPVKKVCYHPRARVEDAPPPNYKQLLCPDCGAYRFLPRPDNAARVMRDKVMIRKLLAIDKQVEVWESSLLHKVRKLSREGRLPRKMSDSLEEIYRQYFPEDREAQEEAQ
jgi:hypothetical protein